MKLIKLSVVALAMGLFVTSCGSNEATNENTVDSVAAPETAPETVAPTTTDSVAAPATTDSNATAPATNAAPETK